MSPIIIPQERLVQGLIILMFCLTAFVIQTEVTQYLQKTMNFKSPYFILIVIPIAASLTAGAYLWYVAVGLTSMSSLTSIYNTSCFFAYIFSVYSGLEHFSFSKAGAVVLSILGVIIITFFDTSATDTRHSTFVGNMVAIISAVLIGLFEVVYKKYAVSESNPTALMSNFVTSYVGLVTFALLWLPLPILHLTGIEPFSLPNRTSMTLLITNAFMGLLYNSGMMLLISITSPVFASVGIMTSIPLISLVDSMLLQQSIPMSLWLGGAIIAIGFLILTRATLAEHFSTETARKQFDDDLPSLTSPQADYSGRTGHTRIPSDEDLASP